MGRMFRNNLRTTKSFKPAMNWKCFLAIIPKDLFGIWNIDEVFKPKNSVTAFKHADYHRALGPFCCQWYCYVAQKNEIMKKEEYL